MTENSSPEPVDLVYLDEASIRPIAVNAEAFARFDAALDHAVAELLARYQLPDLRSKSSRNSLPGKSQP